MCVLTVHAVYLNRIKKIDLEQAGFCFVSSQIQVPLLGLCFPTRHPISSAGDAKQAPSSQNSGRP